MLIHKMLHSRFRSDIKPSRKILFSVISVQIVGIAWKAICTQIMTASDLRLLPVIWLIHSVSHLEPPVHYEWHLLGPRLLSITCGMMTTDVKIEKRSQVNIHSCGFRHCSCTVTSLVVLLLWIMQVKPRTTFCGHFEKYVRKWVDVSMRVIWSYFRPMLVS